MRGLGQFVALQQLEGVVGLVGMFGQVGQDESVYPHGPSRGGAQGGAQLGFGFFRPPQLAQDEGEVAAAGQGVGVVGAQDAGERLQSGALLGSASSSLPSWLRTRARLLRLANWPFTLIAIMPTNHRLMAIEAQSADPGSRALIEKWGRLHAVRSILGISASVLFLWASLQ